MRVFLSKVEWDSFIPAGYEMHISRSETNCGFPIAAPDIKPPAGIKVENSPYPPIKTEVKVEEPPVQPKTATKEEDCDSSATVRNVHGGIRKDILNPERAFGRTNFFYF